MHHIAISLLFVEKCGDPGKSLLLNFKRFKEQLRCANGLQADQSYGMSPNDRCW